ncbi:MAG: phosphoenolpyruvate synthase [Sphingobacteriales bacterium]|nr:MAG: phosphoenolpyruvate synthase [Sphingobacteriales bacterium]
MIIKHTCRDTPYVTETGGKAYNLLLLRQAGYSVPDFIVLPVSFFDEVSDVKHNAEQALIEILEALPNTSQFAVRSSAVAEDSSNFSYAGQFKTLLCVEAKNIPAAIAEVYASVNAQHIAAYQSHSGKADLKMAVIVQAMIPATQAGVAFGIDPLSGNEKDFLINAIEGIGEDLVNGSKNADAYTVQAGSIAQQQIAGDTSVLSIQQIKVVSSTLTTLNEFYKHHQDIEFAFVDDKFYLLQSRPVTTTAQPNEAAITWDNSNIIESYPGLTLPLTFSFIEKMYAAVYRQMSSVMGITVGKIKANDAAFDNMLGLLNGRVYYNLNSWYKVLSLLPGYKMNASFMEKMMGVKDKPDINIETGEAGIRDYFDIAYAVTCIIRNVATARKQKDLFISDFNSIYNQFVNKDFARSTLKETLAYYHRFEQLMVTKWKAPLVNDFFAMVYFGSLQKMCVKHMPDEPNTTNHLIASSKDIITTEPIRRLPLLAKLLTQKPELDEALRSGSSEEFLQVLARYKEEQAAFNEYIKDWGERSIAELKLETITYLQQPELLVDILRSYATSGAQPFEANTSIDAERHKAEVQMLQQLKGHAVKKGLFNHVLKQARYFVSNRENLRYYRTKGFGMVRRMMLGIGEQLYKQGYLQHPRDVFYLHLKELDEVAEEQFTSADIQNKVAQRKQDYQLYQSLPLPERVITKGKVDKIVLPQTTSTFTNIKELQGIPCSAGVVHAKVRLLYDATDMNNLNGDIMATYATDPGWVVLFPGAGGIITERGSLLSHAAIVSREMGIPCIVGLTGLMDILKDGDEILMDGATGIVQIIQQSEQ